MRKTAIVVLFVLLYSMISAYDFYDMALYNHTTGDSVFRQINDLPNQARDLWEQFKVKTILVIDKSDFEYDTGKMASVYYDKHIKNNIDNEHIFIFISRINKEGRIITLINGVENSASDTKIIEEDILNKHIYKWYTQDDVVIAKVLGAFLHVFERARGERPGISRRDGYVIDIDDKLYRLTHVQPIKDIIKLFYFEPITFIIYFPFVTYFVMVRAIGTIAGRKFFYFMQFLWAFLNLGIISLVINRITVLFPVYTGAFIFVSMAQLPLYFWLYYVFKDDINYDIQRYMYSVTGGFDKSNVFEGKKWEED